MSVKVVIAVFLHDSTEGWPYDIGDDPSFRASSELRGNGGTLTWGVCRPDVRNNLSQGDVVVFFAAGRARTTPTTRYRFVGYATVANKISQLQIWTDDRYGVLRRYGNLLIRPAGTGYEHHEPIPGVLHGDWLWRIADQQLGKKDDYLAASVRGIYDSQTRVAGRQVQIADNYVLFHSEGPGTRVLADPRLVATKSPKDEAEVWESDPFSQEMRRIVLKGKARGLRTTNPQIPHRHITHEDQDASSWRSAIDRLVTKNNLRWRK